MRKIAIVVLFMLPLMTLGQRWLKPQRIDADTGIFKNVAKVGSYYLPVTSGTARQVLTTNGGSVASWQAVAVDTSDLVWGYYSDSSIVNTNPNGYVKIKTLDVDTAIPAYIVAVRDNSYNTLIRVPVQTLLAGAPVYNDTTGLDPLCGGLTIYSLADSTMWQHRPVIDTVSGSPTYGDTIGCIWVDVSNRPIITNPTIVMSNSNLVEWADVVAIRQRTPVTFNTKAVPLGSEWYIGVDTVTAQGVATQYDLTQIPVIDTTYLSSRIDSAVMWPDTVSYVATKHDLTQMPIDYSPWDTTATAIVQKNVAKKVHVGSNATPDSLFQVTGGAKFTRDVLVNGVTVGRGRETGAHANYDHNLAVGRESLNANTSGNYNTSVGTQSLLSNTTGASNTSVGHQALKSNTTGIYNTANGDRSLFYNTTGSSNTANGRNSLYSNTTGIYNTANGDRSLYSNTKGNNNTANGRNSLFYNTTGIYNTANGDASLFSNTTGSNNTAVGVSALYSNTTASNLVAVGDSALYSNVTGTNNTAIGSKALRSNVTGSSNTANGYEAGRYITGGATANGTGANSVFIGANTKANANGETNQIVIGYSATGKGSNTTTIGNTSTTDTYLAGALTVDSIPNDAAPDSVVTTKNGKLYRTLMSSGYDSTANPWKYSSGSTIQRGGGFVGVNTTNPLSRFHTVGAVRSDTSLTPLVLGGSAVSSSLTLQSTSAAGSSDYITFKTGSGLERVRVTTDGKVGIGTTNPSALLDVSTILVSTLYSASGNASLSAEDDLFISCDNNKNDGSRAIRFGSNNLAAVNEIMRITEAGSGAVGIGTTAPEAKLHVKDGVIRTGINAYTQIDSTMIAVKKTIYTPANTGEITAGTGITAAMLGQSMYYNGTSAVDITADPQIADGVDGEEITIVGLSDANTLTLDDGTGLQLAGGASFVMGVGDVIKLKYIGTLDVWIEVSRSNN